jgi:iron complex outermembrane receptor protein
MKALFLGVAAACLCLPLFCQEPILRGTVTDIHGHPLPGATVVLVGTSQHPLPDTAASNLSQEGTLRGGMADADGRYELRLPGPGTHVLRATFVGYQTQVQSTTVADGTAVPPLDFRLAESVTLLDLLTVEATRARRLSPFTRSTVSSETLDASNLGQDVPFLLDATPSALVAADAGTGIGYTNLRIRGTDQTRINVTINGVPLNDPESHQVFWVDLPDFASSTEDIQIQRGVGASTNGAGAFGASVNLRTDHLALEPFAELALSGGAFGTRRTMARFGTGLLSGSRSGRTDTGFTLDGRLSAIRSDGYIDRGSADLRSWYLSGAWLGHRQSLRLLLFSGHEITYQAWNGVPAQWVDDPELRRFNVSGTEKSGSPHDNEVDDYTQRHAQLIYNRQLASDWHLNLTAHYTRGFGFFEQYKADEAPERYRLSPPPCPDPAGDCTYDYIRRRWLDNHFAGGIAALNYLRENQRWQGTLSAGWNRYLGDHFGEISWGENLGDTAPGHRYYDGMGDKSDAHVFAKGWRSLLPSLQAYADVQYRFVDYTVNGTDNDLRATDIRRRYHFLNPKAGLTWQPADRLSGTASFAVAHREPNRNDFTDAPADRLPRPERLLNTEINLRYQHPKAAGSLTGYHMRYQDQLILTGDINDVGAPIRSNVPDSYRLGLELAGQWTPLPRWRCEGNLTLSRNKVRDFTEFRDNWDTGLQERIPHGTTDIALSPSRIAFLRFSWEFLSTQSHSMTASLSGKHVGRQFIDNTSNPFATLDPYTVAGFRFEWRLQPAHMEEVRFLLQVNNLLNTRYEAFAWTYRYISAGYDATADDPFARSEGGDRYNLTGYFPQAGRHAFLGATVRF